MVTVKAGVSQRTLLKYLAHHKAGHTIPAHSWFIDQSIGGAVATGSHGSSLQHGSISSQVLSVPGGGANLRPRLQGFGASHPTR